MNSPLCRAAYTLHCVSFAVCISVNTYDFFFLATFQIFVGVCIFIHFKTDLHPFTVLSFSPMCGRLAELQRH